MLSKKEQKFIKSLKVKKYRMREKCFLVEGAKNVQELLASDYEVELVIGTEDFLFEQLSGDAKRSELVSAKVLADLGTFKNNDSGIAIARMKETTIEDIHFSKSTFVLDGVNDPGNLGTIIRTLDWFGFDQVVCSPECADFYHPKVINSTMGSFARVMQVSLPLSDFFERNKLPVVAADMHGQSIYEKRYELPLIVVMGSESHGISDQVKLFVNDFLSIPGTGNAESLNVGVATGIIASYLRMPR